MNLPWEMASSRDELRPTISGMSSIGKKYQESGLKSNRLLPAHTSHPFQLPALVPILLFCFSHFLLLPSALLAAPPATGSLCVVHPGCPPSATTLQAVQAPQLLRGDL